VIVLLLSIRHSPYTVRNPDSHCRRCYQRTAVGDLRVPAGLQAAQRVGGRRVREIAAQRRVVARSLHGIQMVLQREQLGRGGVHE